MKKRILIIDDDELFVDTVRFVLEQEEHDVTDASNGVVGVELAISLRPDLILCDVRMRNMHGYVAVQELRNHPRTSNVPIIMMTGQASAYGGAAEPDGRRGLLPLQAVRRLGVEGGGRYRLE